MPKKPEKKEEGWWELLRTVFYAVLIGVANFGHRWLQLVEVAPR